MSKQTAVEWLTPKILGLTIELSKRRISQRVCELEIMKLIEQAKEMEYEQIIEAFYDGEENAHKYKSSPALYYNETYKGGEQ